MDVTRTREGECLFARAYKDRVCTSFGTSGEVMMAMAMMIVVTTVWKVSNEEGAQNLFVRKQ